MASAAGEGCTRGVLNEKCLPPPSSLILESLVLLAGGRNVTGWGRVGHVEIHRALPPPVVSS